MCSQHCRRSEFQHISIQGAIRRPLPDTHSRTKKFDVISSEIILIGLSSTGHLAMTCLVFVRHSLSSFLLFVILAPEEGLPDTPSEASALRELLSRLFEIARHSPTDCGISLRLCSLLLVLCKLFGMLARERWIGLFAVGLFLYQFWLEGTVH